MEDTIFQSDDSDPGSMGNLERGVALTTLLCSSIPIISIPLIHHYIFKNIYKLTLVVAAVFVGLAFIVYYRFPWIIWLHRAVRV